MFVGIGADEESYERTNVAGRYRQPKRSTNHHDVPVCSISRFFCGRVKFVESQSRFGDKLLTIRVNLETNYL